MAFDEKTKRSDHYNCTAHVWPKHRPGSCWRGPGKIEYQHCNNCMAMLVTWSADVMKDGKWILLKQTRVVEPDWAAANVEPSVLETEDDNQATCSS